MRKTLFILILTLVFNASVLAQITPPDTLWSESHSWDGVAQGYDVHPTQSGGYIIAASVTSGNTMDAFLWPTDSSGATIDYELFENPNFNDEAFYVDTTADGGYLFVGYTSSDSTMNDVYNVKTNDTLGVVWERTGFDESNIVKDQEFRFRIFTVNRCHR